MGEENTPLTGTKPTKPVKPVKPAKKVSTWVQRVVSSLHGQHEVEASMSWLDLDEDLRHFRQTLQTARDVNTPEVCLYQALLRYLETNRARNLTDEENRTDVCFVQNQPLKVSCNVPVTGDVEKDMF